LPVARVIVLRTGGDTRDGAITCRRAYGNFANARLGGREAKTGIVAFSPTLCRGLEAKSYRIIVASDRIPADSRRIRGAGCNRRTMTNRERTRGSVTDPGCLTDRGGFLSIVTNDCWVPDIGSYEITATYVRPRAGTQH